MSSSGLPEKRHISLGVICLPFRNSRPLPVSKFARPQLTANKFDAGSNVPIYFQLFNNLTKNIYQSFFNFGAGSTPGPNDIFSYYMENNISLQEKILCVFLGTSNQNLFFFSCKFKCLLRLLASEDA